MKIIFLDVDGVLNTGKYLVEQCDFHADGRLFSYNAQKNFDPKVLENLDKIVKNDPNTYIVISSTWRLDLCGDGVFEKWKEDESTVTDLYWNALMRNLNVFGLKEKVIGVTPVIPYDRKTYPRRNTVPRGEEIKEWLRRNIHLNIQSFVILDDDTDMEELLYTHSVTCDALFGITETDSELAIKILNTSKFPKL
jgi:hypothetical protein